MQLKGNTDTNGVLPSGANADVQSELPRLTDGLVGAHILPRPRPSPVERPIASEPLFGYGPAESETGPITSEDLFGYAAVNSETAGGIPSTPRYRPRLSPVDERFAFGGEFLDDLGASGQQTSHSPAEAAENPWDYFRARSMSCPELSRIDILTPATYADLNQHGGDCVEHVDFAGYYAFVDGQRVAYDYGPGISPASGERYGQPGSFSPVQGQGPHGGGIFHDPGCYGHAAMYSSSPSPTSSIHSTIHQSELLEPRQFVDLFLPRRLTHQHGEDECSAFRDSTRCPDSTPQHEDTEEGS
ncbi:hypothetical protein DHEL01_v201365 [Diaporthe helianthi]|uniref:Uncharacterized protein n=1 Tax=Diaporthe helianthi TaxID=158607 RepID=A0A2P5ICK4_DIAHE|nr:hypothetical protein DHEL01_v201365 [Diaporthe helianthi]